VVNDVASPAAERTFGWTGPWVAGSRRELDLAILLSLTAASVLWYLRDDASLAVQNVVCWLSLAVLHIWWIVAARQVTTSATTENMRRFWPFVQVAVGCFLIGDFVQLVAIARGPFTPQSITGVPLQTILVVVGVAIMVARTLFVPLGFASRHERVRFWLDAATVLAAGVGINFYLLTPQSSQNLAHQLNSILVGSAIFLVAQFAVVRVLLSDAPPFTRSAGLLALAAAAVETLVQAATTTIYELGRFNWMIAGAVLGNALGVAWAVVQKHQLARPLVAVKSRKRPFSLLPYVAIALTYGLLVLTLSQTGLDLRAWAVLAAAIVSTSLVVVRQLFAFVDNARLAAALDVEVRQRRELAAALEYQAYHDSLTGLANRALFADRVDAAVNAGTGGEDATAVIIVDLDDFKPINDRLGHRAGDAVLAEIAARLRTCVRENDTVARLGGDEFAILLERSRPDVVRSVAARIVQVVAEPISVAGGAVEVGASVGVAVDLLGRRQADALLHGADSAMYVAKNDGKGSFRIVSYDD
jgi:diguanylate cyclase (GGDEF)-like protein